MHLHLISTPGEKDIRYILEVSRPYLSGKSEATILLNHRLHISRLMPYLRNKEGRFLYRRLRCQKNNGCPKTRMN